MTSDNELKREIVEVCRRLYSMRFIAATEGNVSVRRGDLLYFTPRGVCKGLLKADDIITTDLSGKKLHGRGEPSSESGMHLEVYRLRHDVHAVVHAHPPYATAFAVAGLALEKAVLPEVILTLGRIPLARYGTPTTEEIAVTIRDLVPSHDALLLSNHGALTLGSDITSAYYRMETLEHFAWVSAIARSLGNEQVLSREQLNRLYAIRDPRNAGAPYEPPLPAEDAG